MKLDEIDQYRTLFTVAFVASILMLVIIPTQIVVFIVTPIPSDTVEWFRLFIDSPVIAIFHADLFILVNNVLIATIYLAFYQLLKETNKGLLQVAILLGFIGIAAYISSNKTFELLALANQYGQASGDLERQVLVAAGKSLLVGWQGTAFDAYYVLNGITLLVVSSLMFRSPSFTRVTASFGLASGILMCIPSTAGMIGLVFSLLSLIPWYVFTILFARTLKKLGKGPRNRATALSTASATSRS